MQLRHLSLYARDWAICVRIDLLVTYILAAWTTVQSLYWPQETHEWLHWQVSIIERPWSQQITLKSNISPCMSTTLLRSPRATTLVMSEVDRTWLIKLLAIPCMVTPELQYMSSTEGNEINIHSRSGSNQPMYPMCLPHKLDPLVYPMYQLPKRLSWSTMEVTVCFNVASHPHILCQISPHHCRCDFGHRLHFICQAWAHPVDL